MCLDVRTEFSGCMCLDVRTEFSGCAHVNGDLFDKKGELKAGLSFLSPVPAELF